MIMTSDRKLRWAASATERLLNDELQQSLGRDPSLPGIAATVLAPRNGIDWSAAVSAAGSPPLTPLHGFRIASITKPFVAATALRLAEDGRLSLFAPIARYLSDVTCSVLRKGGYQPENLTLFHLLTHTSGLPDHAMAETYRAMVLAEPQRHWTREAQLAIAVALPPIAPAGTFFSYSDTGYIIAGEMIERASSQSLGAALRDQLDFCDIRLSGTHFENLEQPQPDQRRATQRLGSIGAETFDPSLDFYGGGGLVSTTVDIVRFLRNLLQGRLFDRPETLAAGLVIPNVTSLQGSARHSSLLRHQMIAGNAAWCHGSFWGAQAIYFPTQDIAIAVTWNQADAGPQTLGSAGQPGIVDRISTIILSAATD